MIIGFAFGPEVLGGFLAGATVCGVLIGMFQNNAGGAWDNAKKSFEKGVEINGEIFYKKSEPHKASVTGDTVGDPFKDTSGPSMNILIKLMSIVALVIAPTLAHIYHDKIQNDRNHKLELMNEASMGGEMETGKACCHAGAMDSTAVAGCCKSGKPSDCTMVCTGDSAKCAEMLKNCPTDSCRAACKAKCDAKMHEKSGH